MIKILLSGGIDSFVMAQIIKNKHQKNIECVFIDYGQPCANQEWIAAEFCAYHLALPLIKITAKSIDSKPMQIGVKRNGPRVIPGRNKRFIELAAMPQTLSENKKTIMVAIGCIKNDYNDYVDCRRGYFDSLETELGIKIDTPLISMTKKEIIRYGSDLPLEMTWSCYQTDTINPCGECNSCRERRMASK